MPGFSRIIRYGGILCMLAACADPRRTLSPNGPVQLELVSGDNQQAVVGTQLAPLVVRVTSGGNPLVGQVLNFRVLSGGGSVYGGTEITDIDGLAQELWTLGPAAGAQTIQVRAVDPETGKALVFATFTAAAIAGPPSKFVITQGDQQTATAGSLLPIRPAVEVTDANGNPIAGIGITFTVATGGGSATGTTQTTGADGVATIGGWTLGSVAGQNRLTATAPNASALANVTATFTATGIVGAATTLNIVAGDNQTAPAGAAIATPLTVQVVDANGNGVPGVAVTFTVTSGGGSIDGVGSVTVISSARTSATAAGTAAVNWILGHSLQNSLQATAVGMSGSPIVFSATSLLFVNWRTEAMLNTPRQAIATTLAGSTIFAIGGWDANGLGVAAVESLELSNPSAQWVNTTPLPYPLGFGIAQSYPATNPTTVYFFGGGQGIDAFNKETYSLDLTTPGASWANVGDAPSGTSLDYWVKCGESAIYNNIIYFTSECDNSGGSARGFNPATGTYVALKQSNNGFQQEPGGTVAWHNRLYVIGGANGSGAVNYYDMSSNTWNVAPSIPVHRWQGTAQVLNECIYVFGGTDYVSGFYNNNPVSTAARDIYQLCPGDATPTWRVAGQLPAGINLVNPASVVFGGRVYLIGGTISGVATRQVMSAAP